MTITTAKSVGDKVFFLNEREPVILEGTVVSISINVNNGMLITSLVNPVPVININYGITSTTNHFNKEEKDIYNTAQALLDTIKVNSGIA